MARIFERSINRKEGNINMAWQTPITTWGQPGQTVPGVDDFNRIEGNINYIEEESRTPSDTATPAASGKLSLLLNYIVSMIKAITGKANWYTAPDTTLAAAKTHIDAAAPHSGHETPAGAQAKVDAAKAELQAAIDIVKYRMYMEV